MDINNVLQNMQDKIYDLQQQAHFCLNNYDYHHQNNELDILQEQLGILKHSAKIFRKLLYQINETRQEIQRAEILCDKTEDLLLDNLSNCLFVSSSPTEDDCKDKNGENPK